MNKYLLEITLSISWQLLKLKEKLTIELKTIFSNQKNIYTMKVHWIFGNRVVDWNLSCMIAHLSCSWPTNSDHLNMVLSLYPVFRVFFLIKYKSLSQHRLCSVDDGSLADLLVFWLWWLASWFCFLQSCRSSFHLSMLCAGLMRSISQGRTFTGRLTRFIQCNKTV